MKPEDLLAKLRFEPALDVELGPEERVAVGEGQGPVMILANPRSGTTALSQALSTCGRFGTFYEGNAWYWLLEGFQELRRLEQHEPPMTFGGDRTLSRGRLDLLLSSYADLLDSFHRQTLAGPRWLDKTVEWRVMQIVPLLAELIPDLRFVYIARNGVDCCVSNFKKFPWLNNVHGETFRIWWTFMNSWRTRVGLLLGDRGLCIRQEDMSSKPEETVARLREFLDEPSLGQAAIDVLGGERVDSSFASRKPGDYGYTAEWSDEWRQMFVDRCGEEMSYWGYSMSGIGIDNTFKTEEEVVADKVQNLERLLAEERERNVHSRKLIADVAREHAKLRQYAESLERANQWIRGRLPEGEPPVEPAAEGEVDQNEADQNED